MGIKRYIPLRLKQLPWYLFKAPQRRLGLLHTWQAEVVGKATLLSSRLLPTKLQPITICIGIKNRWSQVLEHLLPSLLEAEHRELIQLSIFDCGSTDVPNAETLLRRNWTGSVLLQVEERPFTRSYSFNRAIEQAQTELVFICDADVALPADIVKKANYYVSQKTTWFPIVNDMRRGASRAEALEQPHWRPTGKGLFGAYKWQWEKAGRYDERIKSWGAEDWDLWFRLWDLGYIPIRTKDKDLLHRWHP